MNLIKALRIMAMSGLLMTSFIGNAFAANSNAESQTLNFPITKPMVKLISNVVYEQVPSRGYDNMAMGMDVLKPEKSEKMPAIVFITGGGFVNANKARYIQQRMDLANAGYVVASITYRVTPTATFPQPLEDVKAAIRYLKAHADQFNINPDKVGVMGDSAGGYLSAMASTTSGTRQFDKGDYLDQNSDVQAAVDFYGLSDLTRVGSDFPKKVQDTHKSPGATEALWVNGAPNFGGTDGGILVDPEKAKAANPITYISDQTSPFLLMHGDKDTLVSPSQTEILHQALVAHGIESTRYVVKGAEHGGVYWNQPEVMQIVIDFFDKHLK